MELKKILNKFFRDYRSDRGFLYLFSENHLCNKFQLQNLIFVFDSLKKIE